MKCGSLLVVLLAFSSVGSFANAIPVCGTASKTELGGRLRIVVPPKASIRKGKDIDYESFVIEFREKGSEFVLDGIFGPLATSGQIPRDWLSSSEPTIKTWRHGEAEIIDGRGQLANGNYWRYVGTWGNSIRYHDVTKNAANYFDRILDSVCFK
jgi:hypothetical protein